MSENEHIAKAAGIVGGATLLSRILGLVRDLVTAYFFGAGPAADAFFVAFRIPNLLRRLLAEGALTVSFIPVFTEYLKVRGRDEAFQVFRAVLTLLSLVLAAVTVLGVLLSPYLVLVFAPGFSDDPDKFALTVLLTRIMFPYIFLVGLVALAMGVLNSLGRFAAPALSPVLLNVGMIACTLVLAEHFDPPILALAIGVLIGGILQVLLQVPYLVREGPLLGLSFRFKHPAILRIVSLMGPAALGAAAYQIAMFVTTLLASFLPSGSVSYLYYADRIMQFPLGVFAVALGTAVLPSMSRQAADRDMDGLGQSLSFALRLVFFITLPAMVGLIVLAVPLVELFFQRGRFSPQDTLLTAQALIAYALGLWALSGVQIAVRVFYSLQDTRTPVKIAMISLASTVALSLVLMFPFRHVGLALASSGGSIVNLALLVIVLRRRLGHIDGRRVVRSVGLNLGCSAVMAAVVWLIVAGHDPTLGKSLWHLAGRTVGAVLAGAAVYSLLAFFCRSPEIKALLRLFRRRGRAAS
ncbi:MAG: murein biosynthesis integral membrane protein MurJ [Proteobacteria bacterium]|nr:murein biosynthesis integral membrane protein MurJ [Pseudomonadota bacterium]